MEDIHAWLSYVYARTAGSYRDAHAAHSDLVSMAVSHIESHYREALSSTLLAESLAVSAEHLSRRFKEETGENYVDYLNRTRLEKARELLSQTDLTLEVVAREVGFTGYQYLIRRHKKHFGVTPAQHRGQTRTVA